MPVYDYACQSCASAVEVIHGVNEPGPQSCATCGGPMRKVLSPPAILFKGSGWAKMDARAAARPTAQQADGGKAKDSKDSAGTAGSTSASGKPDGKDSSPTKGSAGATGSSES